VLQVILRCRILENYNLLPFVPVVAPVLAAVWALVYISGLQMGMRSPAKVS
jgi:hypothetical protein